MQRCPMEIRYCNNQFMLMFGHGTAHFGTIERFIQQAYLREQ
ncbi:hypothetical protein BRI6_4704 [plant metagenome]|uniref:Uncharacterized protein n=1 Tax=plant metagenome TaxID=1297885 RepID=A0A484VHK1_9ZZZZ